MKKYIIIFTLIACFSLLTGCYNKTDLTIISGIEKVQIGSRKLSEHNITHCEKIHANLLKDIKAAETKEEKERLEFLAKEELQWINANKKLPIAIQKLLDSLNE